MFSEIEMMVSIKTSLEPGNKLQVGFKSILGTTTILGTYFFIWWDDFFIKILIIDNTLLNHTKLKKDKRCIYLLASVIRIRLNFFLLIVLFPFCNYKKSNTEYWFVLLKFKFTTISSWEANQCIENVKIYPQFIKLLF